MPAQPELGAAPTKRTSSFVCELRLRVFAPAERRLLSLFEASRQAYNACLGEAKRRVRLIQQAKLYQRARSLQKDEPARALLFSQVCKEYGFSEYALHRYATMIPEQHGHKIDPLIVTEAAMGKAYLLADLRQNAMFAKKDYLCMNRYPGAFLS